jgi:hypothetical protein
MAVTSFQDFDLADPDREWDSDAAEKRVRRWAGAEDKPNEKYRDATSGPTRTTRTSSPRTSCSSAMLSMRNSSPS